MSLLLKLCFLVVGLAGVSSTIGIPIALKFQSNIRRPSEKSFGGGRTSKVSIDKCPASGIDKRNPIDFGEKAHNKVCGDYKAVTEQLSEDDEYTDFLKEQGDNPSQTGNTNDDKSSGTRQCQDTNSSGKVMVSDGGAHYLGLCETNPLDETKFVKKVKVQSDAMNKSKGSLWACDKECGEIEEISSGDNVQVPGKEKTENGKQIEFYKN